MLKLFFNRPHEDDLDKPLPRTQTQVMVMQARDNCLIDSDQNVIAAVGLTSLDTALMTDEAVAAKIEQYKDFLKTLRYPIQFLIGTRPQDLSIYHARVAEHEDRLSAIQYMLTELIAGLDGYLTLPLTQHSDASFEQFFGWHPTTLIGTPGDARESVLRLCDPEQVQALSSNQIAKDILSTIQVLERWKEILVEHADLVSDTVQRAQAPVRTFFIVTSHNPRVALKSVTVGLLKEREFLASKDHLSDRCRQIANGITMMGLECWRASHEELLLDLRNFFNPAQSLLARRADHQLAELDLHTRGPSGP